MSPYKPYRSLLAFATCLIPAFVFAGPLATPEASAESLSRRGNPYQIPCGNAPSVIAGYNLDASAIVAPNPDGPPNATSEKYFPYLWCGVGTTTYVYIKPIGNYGYNKGTDQPIFWTGLDGAYNTTVGAEKANAANDPSESVGDGAIGGPQTWHIDLNSTIPGTTGGIDGIASIIVFGESSNHQKLTWGVYGSALQIMKDFVLTYPLYADAMYFQIGESHYSTVGHGYMGIRYVGTTQCYLKGGPDDNGLLCSMPKDYPDN